MQRFTSYYTIVYDGCWEWQGHTVPGRRGNVIPGMFEGTTARRWIYQEHHGVSLDSSEYVIADSMCMTALCVNPKHLKAIKKHPLAAPDYNLPRFGKAHDE